MKFIARTIVLLLIVNGLLLYMHYREAGNAQAREGESTFFSQEIEVTNRADALYIRHHFRGLSNKRLDIVWPAASTGRACHLEKANSCDRLNEGTTAFLESDNDQQSISYEIPKTGQMQQRVLYKGIFATLRGAGVSSTIVHITDETNAGGMWVNGLREVGSKEMELIDYSLYRGSGKVNDLYWQKKDLALLYDGDKLAVYGAKGDVDKFKASDELLGKINAEHSTVVLDGWKTVVDSSRFLISNDEKIEVAFASLLTNGIASRFSFSPDNRITKEVVASILSGKTIGTAKAQKIYTKLNEALTEEEHTQLADLIEKMDGEAVDAAVLDGFVSRVTGFNTSFFKRNMREGPATYPFLLEDVRTVKLNGEDQPDIRIILKDGKSLYSLTKVLSRMGFSVSSNERSIYVEAPDRKYRFPKKEEFYVYNERKYDFKTIPFEEIDGDFYFEENAFKRLFLLSIEKTDDGIDIVPISSLMKEAGQ